MKEPASIGLTISLITLLAGFAGMGGQVADVLVAIGGAFTLLFTGLFVAAWVCDGE